MKVHEDARVLKNLTISENFLYYDAVKYLYRFC